MCHSHSEEVPRMWIHVGIHVSYQGSGDANEEGRDRLVGTDG